MNTINNYNSDHTQVPANAKQYTSPYTGAVLKAINNPNQNMQTWQEHLITLPELCPASKNPGAGSTLLISYSAQQLFLEVFSLKDYIDAFIAHPTVRDVEQLTQAVADDCVQLLQHEVTVKGSFELPALGQRVSTEVHAAHSNSSL